MKNYFYFFVFLGILLLFPIQSIYAEEVDNEAIVELEGETIVEENNSLEESDDEKVLKKTEDGAAIEEIEESKKDNLYVFTHTVDTLSNAIQDIHLGAFGVCTNYFSPSLLKKYI